MNNDEVSRSIIMALLKLANSGNYTVDLDGAAAVTGLTTAANNHLAVLTEALDAARVLNEELTWVHEEEKEAEVIDND